MSIPRLPLPLPLALVALGLAACPGPRDFVECEDDTSCGLAVGGKCTVNAATGHQFCAYPDQSCPEGMRWSDYDVEDSISGACVASDLDAGVDASLTCRSVIAHVRGDGLYVVNPDGTAVTSLVSGNEEAAPSWSPDGTRILFERTIGGAKDLFVVNNDGTGLTNLTNAPGDDYGAAWSPDGTMIAFASERNAPTDGSTDLFVMQADGRSPRMIDVKAAGPSWAPASDRLAYGSFKTSRFQVYVANPDGTGIVNITNSGGGDNSPAWSPDGSRIAFVGLRGGFGTSVYIMNADGTNQRSLLPGLPLNSHPVWSPNGQRIALNAHATVDDESDVYRVNVDGTGIVNMTQGSATEDRDGAWSPDGSQLAIVTMRDGNEELYRINDDGTGPLRMTMTQFFGESSPTWARCP